MNIRNSKLRVLGAFSAIMLAAGLVGCSHSEPNAYETNAKTSSAGFFTVPPGQLPHVQLYNVAPQSVARTLRLTGTVAYNALATTPVISAMGGPVARIIVTPGMHVKRGDPMLYVSSPDYAQLRATYLKASSAFNLADRTYVRAQDLYAHHAIAEADLQAAEAVRSQAQADLQTAEQSLRVIGITNPQTLMQSAAVPEVPLRAPIAGEVVEMLCSPGQLLQAGQTQCFTISDMSTVWVLVNVYQQDLPFVRLGDLVTIHTDAYPQDFSGRISYIGAALDPTSRTLQARIATRNPHEELKKDMYVTASVASGTIDDALMVPDAAVLRDAQNQPFVYLATGGGHFSQRSVKLGTSQDGKTQITSGLQAGDQVVAEGALFLQFANSLQ